MDTLQTMIFDGWTDILRTVVMGLGAYALMVLTLRLSGKRTLAKLNAFDLVVTVALGSTLATILLNKDISLAEGWSAILTLVLCQYAVAWLSVRSGRFARAVRSEPKLLLRNGEILHGALREQRVTVEELKSVVRSNAGAELGDVSAVVLESDGSFSVISEATPEGFPHAGLSETQQAGSHCPGDGTR